MAGRAREKPVVFLSHSSKDKKLVTKIANDLNEVGINAWFDKWDLLPGDSLRNKIFEEGISKSTCVLLLVTQHSIDSAWVQREIDAAFITEMEENNARIITAMWSKSKTDIDPLLKKLPSDLRSRHVADLTAYDTAMRRLISAIYSARIDQLIREKTDRDTVRLQEKDLQILELKNRLVALGTHSDETAISVSISARGGITENPIFTRTRSISYRPEPRHTNQFTAMLDRTGAPEFKSEMNQFLKMINYGASIEIVLQNTGKSTVSDLVLDMFIPEPFSAVDDEPELPQNSLMVYPSHYPMIGASDYELEDIKPFDKGQRIRFRARILVAGVTQELPQFWLLFDHKAGAKEQICSIDYSLAGDGLPQKNGKLSATLKWEQAKEIAYSYQELKQEFDF